MLKTKAQYHFADVRIHWLSDRQSVVPVSIIPDWFYVFGYVSSYNWLVCIWVFICWLVNALFKNIAIIFRIGEYNHKFSKLIIYNTRQYSEVCQKMFDASYLSSSSQALAPNYRPGWSTTNVTLIPYLYHLSPNPICIIYPSMPWYRPPINRDQNFYNVSIWFDRLGQHPKRVSVNEVHLHWVRVELLEVGSLSDVLSAKNRRKTLAAESRQLPPCITGV